ncbi:MAG: DegT/DnrJ/EryC1/StrS family aminotransferase [Bacteroidetes bacterium]|nr:DegT/DnrJ/EryC1/StrS family aminotransferase [Bacteroidota bacterium]
MQKLHMVDLAGQYQKIKPEIDAAIQNVINNTAFINGPDVKSFAAELQSYLNVAKVVPCANGTDALQIAMMALGLQQGDEVISASFTYIATVEVIALLKLTPVLVEVDPNTFCIDPAAIEKAITPKTKAIVPVHLFGQCADMESILNIAHKHKLYVIEDVAQAIGATYTFSDGTKHKSGTMGDIGTTSFFPSKNLGCYGDGGAIFTNSAELGNRIQMIANHGQSVQYVFDEVGCNSRLDTLQAAILRTKLKHLDAYAAARNHAASYYDKAFAKHPLIKIPVRNPKSTHVFHQYTLCLNGVNRDAIRSALAERNIPAMIYYPIPVHQQKAYRSSRYHSGDFPISEQLCKEVISLPMHTELSEDQLKYITENFLEVVSSHQQ